jgi:hypothetical protein
VPFIEGCSVSRKKEKINVSTATAKAKQKQRQKQPQLEQPPHTSKYLLLPKKAIAVLVFLITVASFIFLIYPRIYVYPGTSLDLSNPFKTPFIIKNDGYLPIQNIHYELNVVKVTTNVGFLSRNNVLKFADTIYNLNPNRSSPIFISIGARFGENIYITYADIHIVLTYTPFWVPYTITDNIRFKTMRKSNGEYVWLEYHIEQ